MEEEQVDTSAYDVQDALFDRSLVVNGSWETISAYTYGSKTEAYKLWQRQDW